MKPALLIISFGPSQLLLQIALIRQLGQLHEVVGIVSYVSDNPRIIEFEKKVCEIFGFNYLGSIEGLKEKIVEIGFSDLKSITRTIFCRDLVKRLRKWLFSERLPSSVAGCDLVISYRKNLVSDSFLLHALQPADVLMVSDGFYMTMDNNLRKRFVSFLTGGKFYSINPPEKLYAPAFFYSRKNKIAGNLIEGDSLQWCYGEVCNNIPEITNFSNTLSLKKPFTLILWQNLFPKFVPDKDRLFNFYQQLLWSEAKLNNYQLLVKPHPRSSNDEIAELMDACPAELRHRVEVLNEESLLAVPVEVLLSRYKVSRVAGMASTGIWAISSLSGAEVALYSSRYFPVRLQKEIQRFGDTLEKSICLL